MLLHVALQSVSQWLVMPENPGRRKCFLQYNINTRKPLNKWDSDWIVEDTTEYKCGPICYCLLISYFFPSVSLDQLPHMYLPTPNLNMHIKNYTATMIYPTHCIKSYAYSFIVHFICILSHNFFGFVEFSHIFYFRIFFFLTSPPTILNTFLCICKHVSSEKVLCLTLTELSLSSVVNLFFYFDSSFPLALSRMDME